MDLRQTVDSLRPFVLAKTPQVADWIKEPAEQYAQACHSTNQRLRQCEDYLKQGMRSEAVHFAESKPALLDVVEILDFPERAMWDQFASECGLPLAPRLLIESAQALNRAYNEVQPLEVHLRRSRYLALAGAPLDERLTTLRVIASKDAGNQAWGDDVLTYEHAFFRQFPERVRERLGEGDVQGVMSLFGQLQEERWSMPPPDALLSNAGRVALAGIHLQLKEAHRRKNHEYALQLTFYRNTIGQIANISLDHSEHEVRQALQWLKDLHEKRQRATRKQELTLEFKENLRAFGEAMDEGATLQEFDEMYHDLQHSGYAIPSNIEGRYTARRRILESAEKRHNRERLILTTVITIGFVGLVLFFACIGFRR
jgi:hypothetical protein